MTRGSALERMQARRKARRVAKAEPPVAAPEPPGRPLRVVSHNRTALARIVNALGRTPEELAAELDVSELTLKKMLSYDVARFGTPAAGDEVWNRLLKVVSERTALLLSIREEIVGKLKLDRKGLLASKARAEKESGQ
jgi:predicted transcriptional regulator